MIQKSKGINNMLKEEDGLKIIKILFIFIGCKWRYRYRHYN